MILYRARTGHHCAKTPNHLFCTRDPLYAAFWGAWLGSRYNGEYLNFGDRIVVEKLCIPDDTPCKWSINGWIECDFEYNGSKSNWSGTKFNYHLGKCTVAETPKELLEIQVVTHFLKGRSFDVVGRHLFTYTYPSVNAKRLSTYGDFVAFQTRVWKYTIDDVAGKVYTSPIEWHKERINQ